jgi:hypothetical protein
LRQREDDSLAATGADRRGLNEALTGAAFGPPLFYFRDATQL